MRLATANPVAAHDAASERPREAIQQLYAEEEEELRLNLAFKAAFDSDLVVDRLGGAAIALRCGAAPDPSKFGGRLSMPYAKEVRRLPLLHEQGDGMRSFVSCLLHTEVMRRPIVLIDEPEAFLHPPQARQLAYHLATAAKKQTRQVILATHSADIVRGALEAGGDVSVVRLERTGIITKAAALDKERIAELWRDPLLRVSNLLDGLFHESVIMCEGDADCRFYSVLLDALCELDGCRRPDIFFAHTGGKHRIALAVRALRGVSVPVKVVADLDMLSEEATVRPTWEALDQDWSIVSADWAIVKAAVDASLRSPAKAYASEQFGALLAVAPEGPLTPAKIADLRAVLKADGGWSQIKKAGVAAIPKGQARAAADRLLSAFAAGGLHLVPEGEIEGLVPSAGGHGPGWLEAALQLDLLKEARAVAFVRSLGLLRPVLGAAVDRGRKDS